MRTYFIIILAIVSIAINHSAAYAPPLPFGLTLIEANISTPMRRFMSFSSSQTLKGSRPLKPLSEAPFEMVGKLFTRRTQFLDSSGEWFRRLPELPPTESFNPKMSEVDDHTIRIDLKKK